MVGAAAVRSRAQEAHADELPNAGAARRRDHGRGTCNVDACVGLRADLPVDAGAVRDGRAARERGGQPVLVVGRHRDEAHSGLASNALVAAVDTPRDQDDLVAVGEERPGQVRTDEAGAAGDRDPHDAAFRPIRRRWRNCVGHTWLKKSPTWAAS